MSHYSGILLKRLIILTVFSFNVEAEETWLPSQNPAIQKNVYKAIAQPVKELEVSTEVSGKVTQYPIEFGREIEDGQKIKIEATRIQLEVQLNELEIKASLKALENAKQNILLQEKRNQFLKKELIRAKLLFEKGSLSEGQMDQKKLESDVQAIATQQSKLKELESKTMLEQSKARMQLSEDLLDKHEIDLPAGWIVSRKYIEEQSLVSAYQPLVKLADVSQYKFVFYLNAEEVISLQQKSIIELSLEAPIQKKFQAQLVGVSPVADSKTQKLEVELRVNNASKRDVISGVMAKLILKSQDPNGFLQVHKNFVLNEFEQKYLVDQQNKKHLLTVIRSVGDFYFVLKDGLPDIPYVLIQP
jgi:multidrug efflux pump subunit AcrA (membrane-fusion protein)